MRYANPAQTKFSFDRNRLPSPDEYYKSQGLRLIGGGAWKNALCPFHNDTKPSLRVCLVNGAFKCMACGVSGGDVLDFHRKRYRLSFPEAAKQLGHG
ncbi:CHC2 zinc finger domain-containing protein [Nitrosospira sp. Is2]|uniref:CHC2 zinc finger domain-containing protein n=1 Tax=Nitrosospira sp. Is2 TaxID=3080532 RepID=UPI0039888AA4